MNDAQVIRSNLEPNENDGFKRQIDEAFSNYDKIQKPEELKEYGFYDGTYRYMDLNEVYANMQTAFELKELDNKYYACRDLRNIASTVINSINSIDKYKIKLEQERNAKLRKKEIYPEIVV